MKYIETTTVSQSIHATNGPLIISAIGKRLVIRADIITENADVIIMADEVIIDRCNVRVMLTEGTIKPLLHIISEHNTNIFGASIKCDGDMKVNSGQDLTLAPSPQAIIRACIPDGAHDFYTHHNMNTTLEALGLNDNHEA